VQRADRIPVRGDVAMTGEITLRGKVLPIGGLKEKLLAAHRHGIFEAILPKDNEKDLPDIPENIRSEMKLHFVESMDEVLKIALEREIEALPLPGQVQPIECARRAKNWLSLAARRAGRRRSTFTGWMGNTTSSIFRVTVTRGSEARRGEWKALIEHYLRNRETLEAECLLLDAGGVDGDRSGAEGMARASPAIPGGRHQV
jgi:hypothetical protein